MTFRLYDWGRVDGAGKPRQLHIEESLACIDFDSVVRGPVTPVVEAAAPVRRERLVGCRYFDFWRVNAEQSFVIGSRECCTIVVGVEGKASLRYGEKTYALGPGAVLCLPAEIGACTCAPAGKFVMLECSPRQQVPPLR